MRGEAGSGDQSSITLHEEDAGLDRRRARRRSHSCDFVAAGLEPPPAPTSDPADELKRRLEEARDAPDDRDEFDAAEGQPVDEIEPTRSIAERRQAVHDKAQEALGEMKSPAEE